MRGASQAAYSVTLPAEQVPGCFFSRMTRRAFNGRLAKRSSRGVRAWVSTTRSLPARHRVRSLRGPSLAHPPPARGDVAKKPGPCGVRCFKSRHGGKPRNSEAPRNTEAPPRPTSVARDVKRYFLFRRRRSRVHLTLIISLAPVLFFLDTVRSYVFHRSSWQVTEEGAWSTPAAASVEPVRCESDTAVPAECRRAPASHPRQAVSRSRSA
jgi:hypothetical protein